MRSAVDAKASLEAAVQRACSSTHALRTSCAQQVSKCRFGLKGCFELCYQCVHSCGSGDLFEGRGQQACSLKAHRLQCCCSPQRACGAHARGSAARSWQLSSRAAASAAALHKATAAAPSCSGMRQCARSYEAPWRRGGTHPDERNSGGAALLKAEEGHGCWCWWFARCLAAPRCFAAPWYVF